MSVNGKGAGRTPLNLEYEAGTKLSLFSKARGFLARRQQVTVDAAQREVKLVLAPLPYVVEVVTDPAGARASSVGGGEVTTPGELKFRSMPASRKIVISKDGHTTVTKTITRKLFVEEKSRMAASVRVTLAKDGASKAAAEPAPAPAAVKEEPPAAASAPSVEPPAPVEAPEEPAPVEEAPAPNEPSGVDAP